MLLVEFNSFGADWILRQDPKAERLNHLPVCVTGPLSSLYISYRLEPKESALKLCSDGPYPCKHLAQHCHTLVWSSSAHLLDTRSPRAPDVPKGTKLPMFCVLSHATFPPKTFSHFLANAKPRHYTIIIPS